VEVSNTEYGQLPPAGGLAQDAYWPFNGHELTQTA